MKRFDIFKYIKKYIPIIVIACIVMTVLVYIGLLKIQKYTAVTAINYNYYGADEGKTPDGDGILNTDEIKSSSVVLKALENLNLKEEYSTDEIISRIHIEEYIDPDEEARKEALLDEGEEYTLKPTTFIVSFEATSSEGKEFARKVLDEILDIYYERFAEQYINQGSTTNSINEIYNSGYDYIEMLEIIDNNITDTVSALQKRADKDSQFRSAATGLSFQDLAIDFDYQQSVQISKLYSEIFAYQITKNKNLLISHYQERIKDNAITSEADEKKVDDVLELIEDYVTKMRDSGNTDIDYNYILDEVYDKDFNSDYNNAESSWESIDQTVTYDKLIYSWRNHTEEKEYSVIDTAYCKYIMDIFQKCTGKESSETVTNCLSSNKTCSELNNPKYSEMKETVEEQIKDLVNELNSLYAKTNDTNNEYNEYLGAKYITTLSTVSVIEKMNIALYTTIAAIFFILFCCGGAILIGRISDIIYFVFYTDHVTGLANRQYLDGYIKKLENTILDHDTCVFALSITNMKDINRIYGREHADRILKLFATILNDNFEKNDSVVVYNSGFQFIVITYKMSYENAQEMVRHFYYILDQRTQDRSVAIEYTVGLSETIHDNVQKLRALVSKAYANPVKFLSDPMHEGHGELNDKK